MRHPTGRPFLYFLVTGALLLAAIVEFPALVASTTTLEDLLFAMAIVVFVPFIFVPQLIFHLERRWIRHGSIKQALTQPSLIRPIAMAALATVLGLAWVSLPMIVRSAFGPRRTMTIEEMEKAVAVIDEWDSGDRGDLSVLLAQLTWRWLPNERVNTALAQKLRDECGPSGDIEYCFQGFRTLFAVGAQTPDLASIIVSLSERDPEVRANWRPLGLLVKRGEIAHRYRSMFLDMLGLVGPAAATTVQAELVARLSDVEERSRWAAAGALHRLDVAEGRQRAAAFFAQNVPPLIESTRGDRSRQVRACLFLFRAELNEPRVATFALAALADEDAYAHSCAAFLLLTSGVASELAEERLLRALATQQNHYSRDSFAAALDILGTPRARQAVAAYKAWQPERVRRIRDNWNDRYFRLFGELL